MGFHLAGCRHGFRDLYQHLQGEGRLAVLPSPMENSPLAVRQCLTLGLPFVAISMSRFSE